NVSAPILILAGIFFGADTAGRNGGTPYLSRLRWVLICAAWRRGIGTPPSAGGTASSATPGPGTPPWPAVAVAATCGADRVAALGAGLRRDLERLRLVPGKGRGGCRRARQAPWRQSCVRLGPSKDHPREGSESGRKRSHHCAGDRRGPRGSDCRGRGHLGCA